MHVKKYIVRMDARCNAHPLGFRGENGEFIGCDELCTYRKCTDCVMDSMLETDEHGNRNTIPNRYPALIQVLKIEP